MSSPGYFLTHWSWNPHFSESARSLALLSLVNIRYCIWPGKSISPNAGKASESRLTPISMQFGSGGASGDLTPPIHAGDPDRLREGDRHIRHRAKL